MARYTALPLPSDPLELQHEHKALWNEARSPDDADFFTVGYAGRSIRELIQVLIDAGVSTLIDVRHSPVSMYNPDLSKQGLRRHLERKGMRYLHLRQLGVPRDIRARAVRHRGREAIWEWYDANVVPLFMGTNLDGFFNLAQHPVAFMCVELDPTACHRHRLFQALEERGLHGYDL